MQPRKIILFIVLAGYAVMSHAKQFHDFNPDVSTWIENPVPADKDSFEWHNWRFSAIHAGFAWEVELVDEKIFAKLKIIPYDYADPDPPFDIKIPSAYEKVSRTFSVNDEWFVAFNEYNVGGELWWYSHNGEKSYKVTDAYVTALIEENGDIYFLDAYRFNINPPKGSLQKITKVKNGRWSINKIVPMRILPLAIGVLSNGDFIVADNPSALFMMDRDFQVVELLGMGDVLLTYPRSIVSTSNDKYLYVGSTQYVVEINLETMKVRYLVPSKKFIEHKIDEPNRLRFKK